MKAIVLTEPCTAEEMAVSEIETPEVRPGWILIKIKAFGLNHSEALLREFEISNNYIRKPIVPGIECVGIIEDPSDSNFKKGERVIAMMGGMGRSFNGSYAHYVLMPESHVFSIKSSLDWKELAAVPETFFTAYGSLVTSLQLNANDLLLIRGGTSTVGIAALQLAKAIGATVISTTRSQVKAAFLKKLGADDVILEGEDFYKRVIAKYGHSVSKVLELIGAQTLRESLQLVSLHGIVCHTGLLGGVFSMKNFDPIKEIPAGVYLTGFYSNTPSKYQINGMMDLIEKGDIHPVIAESFCLEDISKAHKLLEKNSRIGKIVVLNDP